MEATLTLGGGLRVQEYAVLEPKHGEEAVLTLHLPMVVLTVLDQIRKNENAN